MSCDTSLKGILPSSELHDCVENNQDETLESLLATNSFDINIKVGKAALAALHLAVIAKNNKAFNLLIENNADLNVQDTDGNTPLHYATESESLKVLQTLISAKADLNVQNTDGNTPLHLAGGKNNMLGFLELQKSGADVSIFNNNGKTPRDLLHAENVKYKL